MAKARRSKGSKRREREKAKKKAAYRDELDFALRMAELSPHYKTILRARGCRLGFYELLDSYGDEFRRVAAAAVESHPTLLGVHEIDEEAYHAEKTDWGVLGYGGTTQWIFEAGAGYEDYGRYEGEANMCGSMSVLFEPGGAVRSVVRIRDRVPGAFRTRERKYLFKLIALVHELGHVADLEQRLNIEPEADRFDMVEAEVFANLHCFDWLAKRPMKMAFGCLHDTIVKAAAGGGYLAEVSQEVLNRLPAYEIPDWQPVMFGTEPTPEEVRLVGDRGMRAIRRKP